MNNFATSPHGVVVETLAGEEEKVYLSHVNIPQLNGIAFPIRTHDLEDAVKMLGFKNSLDASTSDHVKDIIKKGIDWMDMTKTRKLPRRDAWMSVLLSCSREQTGDWWQWLSHQRFFRNAIKTFTTKC